MSEIKEKPKEIRLACFTLAEQSYAIDIMKIRQIIRPIKIRPLPEAPTFVEGVINLRGAVIPIIDLRKRFGVETRSDKEPRVIIVSVERQVVGIVVDEVSEVISVPNEQIQPPPRLSGIPSRFLSGACPAGAGKDDILLILKLDEILTSQEKLSLLELKKPIGKE